MAWRRGTQNQQAGEIRKGHIKEFLVPSSKSTAAEDERVALRIVEAESLGAEFLRSACAYANPQGLPEAFRAALARDGCVHVHAHEHPAVVQRVAACDALEPGVVALSASQLLNNRVCVHDAPTFTLYRGRHEAFDAREAAIGATDVNLVQDAPLAACVFEVRRRAAGALGFEANGKALASLLEKRCFGCVVTAPEVHVVSLDGVDVVARVVEVRVEADDDDDDDGGGGDDDDAYRGRFGASTTAYVVADAAAPADRAVALRNAVPVPPRRDPADSVDVVCSDEEVFPVRRALLRPCLALTAAAQAGRGIHDVRPSCAVDVDCCTFDRVLLYLQHARRGEAFKFDPTLAPELLTASESLKIRGLEDCCRRVLGSFDERVRKAPIRYSEVVERNARGGKTDPRGETWLVLDGMVLDISRWLGEHPGGDSIIPEQALNCDATVMFELYHVSRQSFLYLREFYVGELHPDDVASVPLPNELPPGGDGGASPGFLAELRRHTKWRLKVEELEFPTWKSF